MLSGCVGSDNYYFDTVLQMMVIDCSAALMMMIVFLCY